MVKQTPKKLLLAAATVASLPALASAGARDYAQLGQPCMQRYDSSAKVYKDISSLWKRNDKCQPGLLSNSTTTSPAESRFALTCFVAPNDTGMDPRSGTMDLEGTCLKSSCVGVNYDNVDILPEDQERVTICHRTENELNPWVRMTVDKQAWSDSNNDCGFTTEDYIVKEHGSPNLVQDQMNKGHITDFTTTQEYWGYWERACPYVRQSPEHTHRCCQGPDCCGDARDDAPQEPESPATATATAQFERKLEGPGCKAPPQEAYTQSIYVTFMGEAGQEGMDLEARIAASGTSITEMQEEIKNIYNTQGRFGQCVFFQRLIESVTFDTIEPIVPAINKEYLLTGFRAKATVTGLCTGCQEHLFLPTDSCRDTEPSSCNTCQIPNSDEGEIIQLAGKDLYPQINSNLGTAGEAAEIIRIEGDVVGEPACDPNQLKYLESTGEVVCL
ncbi:unnamed protein product [Cylindrotheca closterium]|uniref:Uncharacterized protein n=1 Tax=Cylindrotheca closterium TaxID=2856 RepID=A0AAD2CNI7_9STRA|nr:unnamed protein product [Cylindrotheca closterium]